MTSPAKPARRRRVLFAAALVAFGLIVGLAGVELVLRVFDPYEFGEQQKHEAFIEGIRGETPPDHRPLESFYLRPNAHVEFLGAAFDFNAEGYRTPVVPKHKPDDVYRIVVVGDSVAFGWGVPEADCFPRRLETLLNERERPFGKDRVEVVNLSGPGRGIGDYIIVLQDLGLTYEPDLVLVTFIFNDVPLHLTPTALAAPDETPSVPIPGWGRGIYTVRWLTRVWNEFRGANHKSDYWIGIQSTPEAAAMCCEGFRWLKRVSGEVPLVLFDTVGDAPGHPLPEVVECTAKMKIPRIECFLSVADWDAKWAIHAPVHRHPNVAAHAVYADTIVAWLEQNGLLH